MTYLIEGGLLALLANIPADTKRFRRKRSSLFCFCCSDEVNSFTTLIAGGRLYPTQSLFRFNLYFQQFGFFLYGSTGQKVQLNTDLLKLWHGYLYRKMMLRLKLNEIEERD
jgi:hypothetical protein